MYIFNCHFSANHLSNCINTCLSAFLFVQMLQMWTVQAMQMVVEKIRAIGFSYERFFSVLKKVRMNYLVAADKLSQNIRIKNGWNK